MARYKLQLKRLDFVSVVDTPAQEPATCLLIKRAGSKHEISATARLVKISAPLGLAFFWAFKSTDENGDAYHDLQGDQVIADDDMVKAAMEFMENGAAVDQQHDSETVGRVIFAMPMTPEIAKAYGVVTKQSGLMVALKPAPDVLKKLLDGTYTGVSIAGVGERVEMKRAPRQLTAAELATLKRFVAEHVAATKRTRLAGVAKQVVLTSEVDGHQHAIDLDDPADWCGDRLSTTYATSEGAEVSHAHVWTFDPDSGAVTIAMDSGHDHTVSEVVPPTVLAAFRINEQAEAAQSTQALLEQVLDGGAGSAPVTVTIASRFSTPSTPLHHGDDMDELKKQLAEAVAKLAALTTSSQRAERIAKMSGAHKAHFDSLTGDDAEAFLAKSTAEREAIVAETAKTAAAELAKRNEVDYVADDGTVYRKSDDSRLVKLAKEADNARRATQTEVLKRRAGAEIGHLPGSDDAKVALLKAVDGIADEKIRGEVVTALKGADAFAQAATKAKGFNPGVDAAAVGEPGDAIAALEKGLLAFCKEQKIEKNLWTDGLNAFVQTTEGAALKHAYDESAAG